MINKMSFYNVQNPSTFDINVQGQGSLLYQGGKLGRIPQTNWFTGASYTFTAEQTIAGTILATPGATGTAGSPATYTLPSATDFITLLLGPGGFDVSSSDIFSFVAFNTAASNTLTIAAGTGGSGSSKTIAGASGGAQKTVNVQVSISVSGGTTTYAYILL